jgi:peroxidase
LGTKRHASNTGILLELQEAYGNVNNIDPFEGGVAEDLVPGSSVGQLFQTIMVNQFTRLRDGDRFFYLNEQFSPSEEAILQQGNTLAKVIEANTGVTNLPRDVFTFSASISGTVSLASTRSSHSGSVPKAMAGITVQLENTKGDVLATTTTNSRGHYSFNQLSGPAVNPENSPGVGGTGLYRVVLVPPASMRQVSRRPSTILISRSGLKASRVNFALQKAGVTALDRLASTV